MVTIWLIGKRDRSEIPFHLSEMDAFVSDAKTLSFERLSDALVASETSSPDVLIVFQHHIHEFSSHEIDRLVGSHPLAHFVVALGPWCASMARSNRIWPDTATVPVHSLTLRVEQVLKFTKIADRPFPATASHEELMLSERDPLLQSEIFDCGVTIVSRDQSLTEATSQTLEALGFDVVPLSELPSASLVICDLDPITFVSLRRLTAFRLQSPRACLIAYTAWPNQNVATLARRYGADFVMSKPLEVAELWSLFDSRLRNPALASRRRAA